MIQKLLDEKERFEYRLKSPKYSLGVRFLQCGISYRDNHFMPITKYNWKRNDNLLFFFLEGEGKFESASTGLVKLKPGDVFFIPSGEWNRYGPEESSYWKEFWITFNGFTLQSLLRNAVGVKSNTMKCFFFNVKITDSYLTLFQNLICQTQANNALECTLLLFEILQLIDTSQNKTYDEEVHDSVLAAIETVEQNPCSYIDFKKHASDYCISYALFRKKFAKYTKAPPYRYLLNHRMQYACSLLADGLTVKEVCFKIGMQDPSHFSKLFSNVVGVSPQKFINSLRQQL